jgi:murein DD-endopeptidase MepM/ murein hydrolase activator NlpD
MSALSRARERLAARRKILASAKAAVKQAQTAVDTTARTVKRLTAAQKPKVAAPMKTVLEDSWGYHPPVHDGMDLICPPNEPIYAMTDGVVVRADAGGWWGKGAPADPKLKAKGDGIIVYRCTENAGPFKKGLNICYGHAENAKVKVGQKVVAGQPLGTAGLANAWHVHLMVNGRQDVLGLGDRDPRPFYDFARKNG